MARHPAPNASPRRRRKARRKSDHPSRWRRFSRWLMVGVALAVVGFLLHWHNILQKRRMEQQLLQAIQVAATQNGLDPALVRAVIWKESRFDPQSIGTKGEIGLMQITSGAVQDWARVNHQPLPSKAELFDPSTNLKIGCWYLAHTRRHWEGYASQEILQLAEYNAGRTKVLKDWAPKTPEEPITIEQITYPSTRNYIQQILERRSFYQQKYADASRQLPK